MFIHPKRCGLQFFFTTKVVDITFSFSNSRLKSREFQLEQAQQWVENKSEKENIINQPTIHRDLD